MMAARPGRIVEEVVIDEPYPRSDGLHGLAALRRYAKHAAGQPAARQPRRARGRRQCSCVEHLPPDRRRASRCRVLPRPAPVASSRVAARRRAAAGLAVVATGFELPPYLVPSPLLMSRRRWSPTGRLLFGALLVDAEDHGARLRAARPWLGVLISFPFVQSRLIETALFPYAVLLQVTPIVAIAPLIIIWVKNPTASLVICATLVALFPIIANTTLGLRSVDPGLQSYFRLNRASRLQTLCAPAHPERAALLLRRPAHLAAAWR